MVHSSHLGSKTPGTFLMVRTSHLGSKTPACDSDSNPMSDIARCCTDIQGHQHKCQQYFLWGKQYSKIEARRHRFTRGIGAWRRQTKPLSIDQYNIFRVAFTLHPRSADCFEQWLELRCTGFIRPCIWTTTVTKTYKSEELIAAASECVPEHAAKVWTQGRVLCTNLESRANRTVIP